MAEREGWLNAAAQHDDVTVPEFVSWIPWRGYACDIVDAHRARIGRGRVFAQPECFLTEGGRSPMVSPIAPLAGGNESRREHSHVGLPARFARIRVRPPSERLRRPKTDLRRVAVGHSH